MYAKRSSCIRDTLQSRGRQTHAARGVMGGRMQRTSSAAPGSNRGESRSTIRNRWPRTGRTLLAIAGRACEAGADEASIGKTVAQKASMVAVYSATASPELHTAIGGLERVLVISQTT